ncbi:MAG: TlpA family protein disulfide reductase [Actinobacteria bacterium]|nr:TlpA family protein disulfide reductase [Actinomycetota bacterium]
MTAKPRHRLSLQLILLAVAAVVSVVVGWVIARNNDTESAADTVLIESTGTFEQPNIETNAAVEGEQLPDATVRTRAGEAVEIASWRGQSMVINIWGSTCGPCKKELPGFASAHAQYGDSVRFVGIDFLPASDHEENFARDRGVLYELFYDDSGEFIDDMGIAAFPVTLFVDSNGTILRQTGQLEESKLIEYIESDLL